MIKAICDHKTGRIFIETDPVGLKELTTEVCGIVNQLYSLMMQNDPAEAAYFQMLMRAGINGTDSPVWDVDDMSGAKCAECIAIDIPKKNPD